MKQHPCGVLGFYVGGAILRDLHNLVGKAPPNADDVVVLMVISAIRRVHPDHVLAAIDRLFPNLQLDLFGRINPRFQLDHLKVEEIAIDLIPIRLVLDVLFLKLLHVGGQHPRLEERVAGLDERLLCGPRLVLVQQRLFSACALRLPPDPRQLFRRDLVAVQLLHLINHLPLFELRRVQAVLKETGVFARYLVCVASPPTNKERARRQRVVDAVHIPGAPVVEAFSRALINEQPVRVRLRKPFFQRFQTFRRAVSRDLRQMSEGVADAFAP